MLRRSPMLRAGYLVAVALLIGASSAGIVAGSGLGSGSGGSAGQPVALLSGPPEAVEQARPAPPNLDALARKAMAEAQQRGADISIALFDRQTGQLVTSGDPAAFPIASVAKLFIADDLLMNAAEAKARLTPEDRRGLDAMLRSSDDFAANEFWLRGGGSAVLARVTARYGLGATSVPYDGNWWNTMSTTADLVRYYAMLLDGTGGLPLVQANTMLSDLAASTAVGIDGYPQRFGIPDGLYAEPVAVKQGWMCCWGGPNQVHLSTGVIGSDRRYVMAIASMQPVDEASARDTLTDTLKAMFPGGRI